jgi:hypothetical protein
MHDEKSIADASFWSLTILGSSKKHVVPRAPDLIATSAAA